MLKTSEGKVILLASDIREMISDVDRSLSSTAKTAGMLPEIFEGSDLPIGQSQKVYERMSSAFCKLVESRAEVVSTVRHLRVLQGRSNCAETATGCPDGWEQMVSSEAPSAELPTAV